MEVARRNRVSGATARKSLAHRVRQGILTVVSIAVLALAVTIIEDQSRGMSPLTAPRWSDTELHSVRDQAERVITEMVGEVMAEGQAHTLLFSFTAVGVVLLLVLSRT